MGRGSGGGVLTPVQLRLPLDFFRPALFICAPANATAPMIDYARYLVGWLRQNHKHWRIITGDGYGVDAEIVRAAKHWGIPITVHGHTNRPRNGASLSDYTRLPYPDRSRRDRSLVYQADKVIFLSSDGHSQELESLYHYARTFKQKKVSLKTFSQPSYLH